MGSEAGVMRFDDDNSQSFGPVLRRIAILAVVVTAVPVMLWSITAFMRTYVAQPTIPSARPLAATAGLTPASAPSADNGAPAQVSTPVVEARATATDARGADADSKSDQLSDGAAPAANAAAPATTASISPAPAAPTAWPTPQPADQAAAPSPANSANSPWPDPSQAVGEQQLQTAAAADDSADALPASAPLTGPIPLPPHRPKFIAVADGSIPLPRARPTVADAETDPPADNGNFFTHLFGQTH
jgi:hypothetical protein